VVQPHEGLETARIFGDPLLNRENKPAIISGFAANPYSFGVNDLQPVAQRLCAGVDQAIEWLGSQGLKARMTGSGSAVFAPLVQRVELREAPLGWRVRECSNLEAHPLAGWASSDNSLVGG